MTYDAFKSAIESALRNKRSGATWNELKWSLGLPYDRPCPGWTRRLEKEIGLVRRRERGPSKVWSLPSCPLDRPRS